MSKPNEEMKRRLLVVLIVISFLIFYIIISYYKIQILEEDYYSKKALDSQTKTFELPAKRGIIYDRNGEKLAYSVTGYRIYINKEKFDLKNKKEILEILDVSEKKFDAIYKSKSIRGTLARHVDQDTYDLLKVKNYYGIWIEDDPMRVYPYNEFASRTIGHTNIDMEGISGVEYSMNTSLKGTNGFLKAKTDAAGRKLAYDNESIVYPTHGANVFLTIDEVIQHFVQKSIKKGMEETEAKRISAIVMEVKTGEILAMASSPSYDLNNPRSKPYNMSEEEYNKLTLNEKVNAWNKNWNNSIVSSIVEPGSTFKIITAVLGLEENVVTPYTMFNETTGYIDVFGTRIHCWYYPRVHGKETFVQALENSCNPVFVKVAQEIGMEKYHDGMIRLGLNDKLTIRLPGVLDYKVKDKEDIGPVELATISYGHGVSLTPMQLIRTLSAVVNDGNLVEPRIIKKVVKNNGDIVEEDKVKNKRKIISDKTSRDVRLMLESVVKNGSGKGVNIPGIRIGGKTGTTMKFYDGEYQKDKVLASFFAFAPVKDPEIAVLVVVDEPKSSIYGSVVAAPIVKDIMKSTLRHIGVKPDFNDK